MAQAKERPRDLVCVLVPEVIGVGSAQAVIVQEIPLSKERDIAAIGVEDLGCEVTVERCTPCSGKVFIQALVRKTVAFRSEVSHGVIGHATIQTPIHTYAEVPEALPSDYCIVEEAAVDDSCSFHEPLNPNGDGTFTALVDRTLVRIVIKVVRPTQLTIPIIPCSDICPSLKDLNNRR
ncbi:MAG: hypothetical protein GX030_08780 [Firmicutes bacterium]|nr:hypothetical protein [Bacillota bacterium]